MFALRARSYTRSISSFVVTASSTSTSKGNRVELNKNCKRSIIASGTTLFASTVGNWAWRSQATRRPPVVPPPPGQCQRFNLRVVLEDSSDMTCCCSRGVIVRPTSIPILNPYHEIGCPIRKSRRSASGESEPVPMFLWTISNSSSIHLARSRGMAVSPRRNLALIFRGFHDSLGQRIVIHRKLPKVIS